MRTANCELRTANCELRTRSPEVRILQAVTCKPRSQDTNTILSGEYTLFIKMYLFFSFFFISFILAFFFCSSALFIAQIGGSLRKKVLCQCYKSDLARICPFLFALVPHVLIKLLCLQWISCCALLCNYHSLTEACTEIDCLCFCLCSLTDLCRGHYLDDDLCFDHLFLEDLFVDLDSGHGASRSRSCWFSRSASVARPLATSRSP